MEESELTFKVSKSCRILLAEQEHHSTFLPTPRAPVAPQPRFAVVGLSFELPGRPRSGTLSRIQFAFPW